MVVEGLALSHDDAGTNRSCKLFWIADPGKSQHIATFRDATQSGSGTRRLEKSVGHGYDIG
jgi:hypothetical protein